MTYDYAEALAKALSAEGWKLKLYQVDGSGWWWEWWHQASGRILATGEVETDVKGVALVFALQSCPRF